MAVRTKDQFKALYGTSGSVFPDNTTGDIGPNDVRAQGEDIADSVSFSGGLNYTIVEIPDWNIYVTGGGSGSATKVVAHGIADITKIRSVTVLIRNDAGTNLYFFPHSAQVSNNIDATNINLQSNLDFAGFSDDTSYVRGWVTIGYVD